MNDVIGLCVAPDGAQDEVRSRLASESGLSVVGSASLAAAKEALREPTVDYDIGGLG